MNKLIIVLFFVAFTINMVTAQTSKILQLETKLETSEGLEKYQTLSELAELYLEKDNDKTIFYLDKIEKLKKLDIPNQLKAEIYNSYGAAYYYKKNYVKSAKNYEDELEILKKTADNKTIAESQFNLAILYLELNKNATKLFDESLENAKLCANKDLMMLVYKALYDIYDKKGNDKDALKNYKEFIALRNEQINYETNSKISILRKKYKVERTKRQIVEKELDTANSTIVIVNEDNKNLIIDTTKKSGQISELETIKENQKIKIELQTQEVENKNLELSRQRAIIFFVSFISLIILITAIWLFKLYKQINTKNKVLHEQKEEIETQRDEIEYVNAQMTDSISYARRIQDAILIPEKEIKKHLPDMFIYYVPRDIVSGDFYWFSKIDHKYIIAAIDCTGHGVPGAFLSMIGNTLLNEIVNDKKITKPDEILALLHTGVLGALQQNKEESIAEDGMDMSLCTIDIRQKRFQFAGAKNHLYVIQGDQLKVLKANYNSIGGKPLRPGIEVKFTSYDFMFDDKTSIYMLSDGYLDQFGGNEDLKFNVQRFKQMLLDNRSLTMSQQKEILQTALEQWKGSQKQVDDILVLGIKLSDV